MITWLDHAIQEVLARMAGAGRWPYRCGLSPAAEPTAICGLGLFAAGEDTVTYALPDVIADANAWISHRQQVDGSVGIMAQLSTPGWATAPSLLLWSATGGKAVSDAKSRAVSWLLGRKGEVIEHGPAQDNVLGHDTTLLGWPWCTGTHSWVEPTAMAILALTCSGHGNCPRVQEGIRLLVDRSLPHGGWNYGNREVFRQELHPQPAPTGLALLALAGRPAPEVATRANRAIDYLRRVLPEVRAPLSLGWGILGLRAWDASPPSTEEWLLRSFLSHGRRPDSTLGLGLLLLASGNRSIRMLVGPSHAQGIASRWPDSLRGRDTSGEVSA